MTFTNFLKVAFLILWVMPASAQPWFNWDYTGPDTIAVGNLCKAGLQWGGDSKIICTPRNPPGQVVISKTLKSISDGYFEGSQVPGGTTVTVTYEAKDNQGHTEEFSFTIYFADKTPPVFNPASLPPDITITCKNSLPSASITATDNCTPAFQIQITQEVNFPLIACSGEFQRIFTAKDLSGNSTTYIQNITLQPESIAPVITSEAVSIVYHCDTTDAASTFQQWIDTQGGAIASDNCGIAGWTTIPANPTISDACNTPTSVTFVVSDFCGNTDSTTATFEIIDQESPELISSAIDLLTDCQISPDTALVTWLAASGNCIVEDNCIDQQYMVKTFIYQGEPATLDQLVDVLHDQLNNPAQTVVIGGVSYSGVRAALTVEFHLADFCNEGVATTATFAILDTTAPVIITAGDDTTTTSCAIGNLEVDFTEWYNQGAGGIGSDDCGAVTWYGTPTLSEALDSLQSAPSLCNQSLQVVFHLKDISGNVSVDSFASVYHIKDISGPNFTQAAQDYNLVCLGGAGVQDTLQAWINVQGGAQIEDCNNATWDHFEWKDNVGVSGNGIFGEGPYPQLDGINCNNYFTVYFYAKDGCNNMSVDSALFNLLDTLAPIATQIPNDTTITCDSPIPSQSPVFSDNCGIAGEVIFQVVSTQSTDLLSCAHYTYQVTKTWSATDFCGNITTVIQTISVVDTIAPTPDTPLEDLFLQCTDDVSNYLINFSDNCSFVQVEQLGTTTQSGNPADCNFYNYLIEQSYTVKDVCLNQKTYNRIITVTDDVAPEIDNSEPLVLNCVDSIHIAQVISTLASDNCANELNISIDRIDTGNPLICSSDNYQKWLLTASDPCGNTKEDTILVNLQDAVPPQLVHGAEDVTLACGSQDDVAQLFQEWLDNKAGADAVDACGQTFSFAAIPGSYDIQDASTFPGQTPQFSDLQYCDSGAVAHLTVDFVFYDQCANTVVSSAVFIINDTIAPQMVACVPDVEIIAPAGQCTMDYQLQPPTVFDACANTVADSTLTIVYPVTSVQPGNGMTPVSALEAVFDNLATGGSFASFGSGTLQIDIENGDIEADQEFLLIYDEEGGLLGQTNHSSAQCSSSSTQISFTESQFGQWVADGKIVFYLKPNDPTPLDNSYTVNDICGGTTVQLTLDIKWNHNPQLRYTYQLDTLSAEEFSIDALPVLTLKEGIHHITYEVKDCGDNAITCIQEVFVRDTISPIITCGADITVTLSQNKCDTLLSIPLPLTISDNCGLSDAYNYTIPSDSASAWLTFASNPNLQNYIAQDKIYTFHQVSGHVTNPVLLNVFLRGDIDSGGEYFTVLGEDGSILGTTEAGQGNVLTGNCNKVSTAYFNIPPAKFNAWAQDGSITFTAISNKDFNIPPGNAQSGINPCSGIILNQDGQTDSISFMFMELKYTTFTPPSYFATGATDIPFQELAPPYSPPQFSFNAGITHFSYTIEDRSGNTDTCTIVIDVKDIIAPNAVCKNATLHVHPSGIFPGVLTPQLIDGGSEDNCSIDSMYVSRSLFSCVDIGTQPEVVLYVVDGAGLIDSCRTQVLIDKAILNPTYSLGLCDNDSLRLFANMPDLDLFDQYTYSWTGPNNFSSNEANPIIPNATSTNSGTYRLEATGFNGCGGIGFVQVFINDEINTPIIGAKDSIVCQNQTIVLFTQTYSGNIKYKWYEGFAPNGVLLDSTVVPQYTINRAPGDYYFYVIVSENDCVSNPSASVEIHSVLNPIALVDEALIQVCQGGDIILGSPMGSSFEYSWTGPNGFVSTQQYPPAISPAELVHAGIYSLIVSDGNCKSAPTPVMVTVSKRPDKPTPTSNSPICLNSELVLTSNISIGVDTFIWKRPDGSVVMSDTNPLIIASAGALDNGLWTLTLQSGGCHSVESEPIKVEVNLDNVVTIIYNSPVCEGDSVQLSTNPFAGATYKWTGPDGFNSSLPKPTVKAAKGSYSVTVTTVAGCVLTNSVELDMNTKPKFVGLNSTAHDCLYPDEVVTFNFTTNIPESELGFLWKGPGGFASTEPHPTILGANLVNGIYSVVATSAQGCSSDTMKLTIQNTLAPEQPIISGLSKVCSGDTLVLTASNLPAIGKYIWTTPSGIVNTATNTLNVTNIQVTTGTVYSVVYESGGCQSKSSSGFDVLVVQKPARPVIIGDPTVCLGDSIILEISNPPNYEYNWSGPGGITSSQKKWVIFPSQPGNAGNYFLTLTNDGCVSKPSDAFALVINQPPPAPNLADLPEELCVSNSATVLTLCVTSSSATPNASYTFYNTALTTPVAGPTNGLCANVTNFSQLNDGINNFYAIATLNTCPSVSGIPAAIKLNYPPEEVAETGKITYVCSGDEIALKAKTPFFSKGKWTSLNPDVIVVDPSNPNTIVKSLKKGKNVFVWSLDYNNCFNFSRDTMVVWVPGDLKAQNDVYRFLSGSNLQMEVLANDSYNTPISLNIIGEPKFGIVEILNGVSLNYTPSVVSDYDKFTYEICVEGCPDLCAKAEVVIDIDSKNDCVVPNIITPNRDGVNDFLRIACLEQQAINRSKISIFNEWGGQVYEASPYLNNWDGKYKGSDLPSGTYFYVFDMGDQSPVQKGFLIIKR